MNQFDSYDKSTHEKRLQTIFKLSYEERKKQFPNKKNMWTSYLDDGCVALYHCVLQCHKKELHHTVEFALRELEKIYNVNGS